jgi:hypothetical protein
VTVTAEQWASAAADLKITVDELHAKIAEIDSRDVGARLAARHELGPLEFDRDGEPLTFGQWAMLYESRSYRWIAEQVLPNRYWIATIWQGINEDFEDPPVVMETSVFHLHPEIEGLPPAELCIRHTTEADALRVHAELVRRYANAAVSVYGS